MLIAFAAGSFVSRAAFAQGEEPEAEELIFEVLMPPFLIADGVYVFQYKSRYYLPIIQLAEGLEFYVQEQLDRGYVSGWYLEEANSFVLDAERNEIIVKGERRTLSPEAILRIDDAPTDDIYVQLETLNEIWPLNMQVDLSQLAINIDTDEDLAFVERLKRKEKREKLFSIREGREEKKKSRAELVPWENNYMWLGPPILDLQANYTYDNAAKELTGSNTVSGTQQIAKMLADYTATFTYEEDGEFHKPDNIRLRFQRQAFGEEALPLGLRSVEGGDINVRQRDLIDNSVGGRGAQVSTFRNNQFSEFDHITIEGQGPPGWEIELYNNNELLTFGSVPDDGLYRFEDVLLRFGNNTIRTVLYGPQGQVRENVEVYTFGGQMLPPGEAAFSAGFADADEPFIKLEDRPSTSPEGVALTTYGAYGIGRGLTLFGSATKIPTIEGETVYGTLGASFAALGGLGSVEAYKGAGGGTALDTRFITELLGVKLNLRNSFFRDFESPDTGFGTNAKRFEGEYQANKNVSLPFGSLGLRMKVLHRRNVDEQDFTNFDTQQTLSRGGVRVSNDTSTRLIERHHATTTGRINTTVRFNQWQVRGNLNYSIFPIKELTSTQGELRYKPNDSNYQAALTLRHDFQQANSGAGVQFGYDFGKVLSSFDTDYQEERGWQFMLRASTSFSPYNNDGAYDFSSHNQRGIAPVRGHVFLDNDGDGVFSPDIDEPMPEVSLNANTGRSKEQTDEDGYMVYALSPQAGDIELTVDEGTLIDPYYIPSVSGYKTSAVVGKMPTFEFPIIETGAVDGTVAYDDGSPISGLNLELVNDQGEVVQTVQTAFDGFYTYEFVAPGTYTVRADPTYGVNIPPETVTVASDDLFQYGIDLQLMEQADEEATAAPETYGPVDPAAYFGPLQAQAGTEAEGTSEVNGESGGIAQSHLPPQAAEGIQQPAPSSDGGGFAASVRRVRIGEHPDKVRFVMDLSGPIRYDIRSTEDGKEIVVDMPGVAWDAIRHWRAQKTPIIQGYETEGLSSFKTEALPGGGTRLRIEARSTMIVSQSGLVGPDEVYGDRLFIDLVR